MRIFFRFPERLWLARTPRRLFKPQVPGRAPRAVAESFITALAKDSLSEVPLRPSFIKHSLLRTLHTGDMLDMLTERVEAGAPLEALNLGVCEARDCR
jgi:hypothetical protein